MRFRLALLAAAAVAAGVTPLVPAVGASVSAPQPEPTSHSWKPGPAKYGIAKQNVEIRMDDGIELSATILRPATGGKAAKGRFPVILTQTPYNKSVPELNMENDFMVEHGYIQVLADVRGTGSSQGEWSSFGPREQKDYCETAKYALKIPGSDGRMGLDGGSYGGIDQLYTATCDIKAVKAEFPIVPMGDAYRDVTVSGGETDTAFIPSWMGLVTGAGLLPTSISNDPAEAVTAVTDHATGAVSFQVPVVASAVLGTDVEGNDNEYDTSFYTQRSPLNVIKKVTIPTFIVGGEYDLFQRGEPMLYQALRRQHVPTRLLIGPWTHLSATSDESLLQSLELRWFDHYVRGVKDPMLGHDVPKVSVYRIGADKYVRSSSYPLAGTRYVTKRLATGSKQVPYVPVGGVCSSSTAQWTAGAVPINQPVCTGNHAVNDKLGATYDFPVKKNGLNFDGTSMARLYVSTTRSDAFITARLEDVAPDGTSTPLTNGWQLLSLRKLVKAKSAYSGRTLIQPWHPDTRASVEAVKAGHVYRLDVEIFPTAARIPAGDKLRLAIQSSDEPHLTASVPSTLNQLGGIVTIHSSKRYPSALVLGRE